MINSAISARISEEICVTGVQAALVLVSLGKCIKNFLVGMCEECRKLASKYLGDTHRKTVHNFLTG